MATCGALYLFGIHFVTVRCNIPLNNALAGAESNGADADGVWRDYLVRWTRWNHVRTIAALAAAALLTLALSRV
ncbi:MAG: anthrone oxygenase family protein [Steroidobacter sp.]